MKSKEIITMTQEDKQLLLKVLCEMLPHGVVVSVQGGEFDSYKYSYQLTAVSKFGQDILCKVYSPIYTPLGCPSIENIKPYLRPMSSMTEEEKEEERKLWDIITITRNDLHYIYTDFLLSHHFDYCGLIEKGLALEAPEGMYNIK